MGSNVVFDLKTGKAKPEPVTIRGQRRSRRRSIRDDNLKYHTDNWFQCMRNRKTPNGNIETGFAHAVAVVMATRSYREGKEDVLGSQERADSGPPSVRLNSGPLGTRIFRLPASCQRTLPQREVQRR